MNDLAARATQRHQFKANLEDGDADFIIEPPSRLVAAGQPSSNSKPQQKRVNFSLQLLLESHPGYRDPALSLFNFMLSFLACVWFSFDRLIRNIMNIIFGIFEG